MTAITGANVALQGAVDLMDGKGTLVTALVIAVIVVGYMYWQQSRDSAEEKADLNTYNRELTDKLFTALQDNGKIISSFIEKLNDVIKTKN